MKKFFLLLTVMAFMVAAPLAMAADKDINCCIKGDCKKMTKAECKKEKGKVVKDCKDCKPPKTKK
jgi:hypothetical protein